MKSTAEKTLSPNHLLEPWSLSTTQTTTHWKEQATTRSRDCVYRGLYR